MDPLSGYFIVRYPNSFYLTLKNTDYIKVPMEKPINIDYWFDYFNPDDPEYGA